MLDAKDTSNLVERVRSCIEVQLSAKPYRLDHSRRVAETAVELAGIYGVDEQDALIAGLLHDYGKAYSFDEQLVKARALGLDYGVELALVAPILHGPIAAAELRPLFPELSEDIFTSIERHTVPAKEMSPLDMVIFIADGIEPGRPSTPAILRQRSSVGEDTLDDLFFACFAGSIAYVLETERYLWPGSIETYNHYVSERSR